MSRHLRTLFVEDNEDDASLVALALRRGGFEVDWERVETRDAMAAALDCGPWDLIVSDFRMPHFSAAEAVALYRERALDTPFILVSGTVGEKVAVDALRAGAHDFFLKSELTLLPSAVDRELREAENRAARREAERTSEASRIALERSEARLARLIESAPDGMVIVDAEGTIVMVNAQTERTFGYPRSELLGRKVEMLIPAHFREGHIGLRSQAEPRREVRTLAGARELFGLHRDGHEFPVEILLAPFDTDEGRLIASTVRDITARKQAEAELQEAQRLEAIGSLAGGVAHDFNNLLGVILGHGELALLELVPGTSVYDQVEQIVAAATHAADLTRQLQAFGRRQLLQPRNLDLNRLVSDTDRLLGRVLGEHIVLRLRLEKDLGTARADPGQIERILLNLALNARDAMPQGGTLTLETANVEVADEARSEALGVAPGSYVLLAVADTGMGMTAEVQHRIFEPFFSTKGPGRGRGLGLASVHGIVKQSSGEIRVESRPGHGTTFRIYLPRLREEPQAGASAGVASSLPHGRETVLVAEDNPALLKVLRAQLEALGYTVVAAANGAEALQLLRAATPSIDLLLTDLVMPELGGADLARQVSELRPGLRVLFMTGYADIPWVPLGAVEDGTVILEKPFGSERLAYAVRAAMDRPAPA